MNTQCAHMSQKIDHPVRLGVISTSRADLAAQKAVLEAAESDPRFVAKMFLVGHHVGNGEIDRKQLIADLERAEIEIVLLNGDRYELLDAALACTIAGIPIAHAAGGERTLGAIDDQIRDSLTKLAHLHYPVHEPAGERLRLLQEDDSRICVAGEPAIDSMMRAPLVNNVELLEAFGVVPERYDVVVAVHPVTRYPEETDAIIRAIAGCIRDEPMRRFFLSTPNKDPGWRTIDGAWQALSERHNARFMADLGHRMFRGLVRTCGILIGNSSAGLYEAPSLGAVTVDIGRRQQGRVRGESVFTVEPDAAAIREAMRRTPTNYVNPYGDGNAGQRILDHLWNNARRADVGIKP